MTEKPPEEAGKEAAPAEGCGGEITRLKDQLLRLQADFENARRRWRKEQAEIQERANADLLRELLEIHDDFQRALKAGGASPDQLMAGIGMISRRLEDFLKSYGIVPIEAEGKLFDPVLHEAVAHEADESVPESTVLAELRRGYTMNGRVLRTSVVKVAAKPEAKGTQEKENEDGKSDRN